MEIPDREDREFAAAHGIAANDHGGAEARIGAAVMTLARLQAANDNAPADAAVEP